jgi:hypothetical protein
MASPVKSLLHLLFDVILFAFMLLGVVGIVFKFIMPEGLLSQGWDLIWNKNPTYSLLLLLGVMVVFVFGKGWLDNLNLKDKPGNFIAYAWALLGVYFAVKLALHGTL